MGHKYTKRTFLVEVLVFILALLFLIPFYFVVTNSFKSFADILLDPTSLPKKLDFHNYINANKILHFKRTLVNSLTVTIFSNIGLILISSMAAYRMVRKPGMIKNVLFGAFVASMVVPFQSIMIPLMKVTSALKLYNSIPGLVVCYFGFGVSLSVFLYHGFIKTIPKEIEEAAIVDGCSAFGVFWRIVFPLLKPITITILILNSLWIWNDFLLPSLILTKPEDQTIPLATSAFFAQYTKQWDLALAGLVLGVIPIIIFFFALQKHIIKGITAGSVKG